MSKDRGICGLIEVKKSKYYAVRVGRGGPAVYCTWRACKAAVNGYSGAKHKSFYSRDEAERFAFGPASGASNGKPLPPVDVIAYTDGSFNGVTRNGFGLVLFNTENIPMAAMYGPTSKNPSIRNIGGEIEAAEKAIQLAIERGYKHIRIYHDYEGVGAWANNEWQRNKVDTISYHNFVKKARKKIAVSFYKVRGHSGNRFNNMADKYAAMGADSNRIMLVNLLETENPTKGKVVTSKPKAKQTVVTKKVTTSKPKAKRTVTRCPHCQKRIAKAATVCRHCGTLIGN